MDYFTIEEENLMCIFDVSSRGALITELRAIVPYFTEPELCEIAETALKKLDAMTDAEFSALTLIPAYYNDEQEV